MKLARVLDKHFEMSMGKLIVAPLPLAASMKLKKILKKIDEEISIYNRSKQETLVRLVGLDKNGKLNKKEDGSLDFKTPEDKQSFVDDHAQIYDLTFDLPETLKASDLGKSLDGILTTADLISLEDIITE